MTAFNERVALVTGGGSGIGKAVATQLAKAGATVVIADLGDNGKAAAEALQSHGLNATSLSVDVSDSQQVAGMIDAVIAAHGQLDIAVNNAGIDPEVSLEASWEETAMEQVFNVNLKGVFLCLKHELQPMLAKGQGRIVNMASAAGLKGVANKPAYTASKHGVVGLTRAAALQYAGQGIRINAVCPGAVDTAMLENNLGDAKGRDLVALNHPIQRIATAEEIAQAVVWLCSDESSYVVGQALAVDGGLTV